MLLIIIITLISVYLSLVIGTIKKFENNGINLSFFTKILTILLPMIIFLLHLRMACGSLKTDKHKSLEIIKMGTLHYPIAVGILIEVTLEEFAHRAVFGHSLTHIKKEPINISADTLKKQRSSLYDIYEKTTVDLATC